jgi:PAS domain S-box-containing protein
MSSLTVLLIDDNSDDRALVERELKQHIAGVQTRHSSDAKTLREAIEQGDFDLVVTDYRLRWTTGTEVLRELKRRFPQKPVIMFTGSGNEEVAVSAMKEGLDDYITKTVKHYPRIPYAVLACVDRARQREQLAQALERETLAKMRLEIALASARMGTWQVDLRTNDVSYSPAIGPMFGRSEGYAHASFQDWLKDVHPDDQSLVTAAWDAALAGTREYVIQFRALGADGIWRWIASSGKVIRDGGEQPKLVIGTARDVTDEVDVHEQIVRQQEDLQTILNVLPVGVAISHDAQANSIEFTPYLTALFDVEPGLDGSATGKEGSKLSFRSYRGGALVPPEDLPMQRAARTGMDVRGDELEVRFSDGRTIDLLVNTSPLRDKAGQVRGAVGALMDVSALKHIQHELETANRQKTEFLSVLSHELRNPMAAISYSIEMLRHVASSEVIDKARTVIERQAAHMGKLLDDLLDLSRITRSSIELELDLLDLRRVIELGYESAKSLIKPFGHEVTMNLPPQPIWVQGDEVRLTQVITNVLGNAAKFTPAGGRITISAKQAAGTAILDITDNGVGIEKAKLDQIFDMFYQAQPRSSGGTGGLGIGLAVVQKIVSLHGGSVQAYSEGLGQGARFRIVLKAQSEPKPECIEPLQQPAALASRQGLILVADDNVDAAESLSDVLRMKGYTVLTAYDGRAAMALATRSAPDIAVLDIGMPFATGNEVARWIRQQPWGSGSTLIAVTGWGQSEDREATSDAGFDVHLVKPVNVGEIENLIAEALSKTGKQSGF